MTTLDHVAELVPGHRAVATRHVPHTLDVFTTHFPRFPVLPGVLILDDLVEVARLVVASDLFPGGWVLDSARRVRYRHFVSPGDSMVLTATVVRRDETTAVFRGTAHVDSRQVTTVNELVLRRVRDMP